MALINSRGVSLGRCQPGRIRDTGTGYCRDTRGLAANLSRRIAGTTLLYIHG